MCCVSWGVGSHTRDDSATEYMYGNCEEHLGARKKELTTENTASVDGKIQIQGDDMTGGVHTVGYDIMYTVATQYTP